MPQCTACGLTAELSTCSRCKKAQYCSLTCQIADWPIHKTSCKRPNYVVHFQVYPDKITNPPVHRTLSLPSNTPFSTLHIALQIAFGWANTHSYEFVVNDPNYDEARDMTSAQHIAKMAKIDALMGDTDKWQGDPTEPRKYLLRVTDDQPKQPGYDGRRDRKIDRMHLPRQVHPRTPAKGASKTKLFQVFEGEKYKGQLMTYIYDLGDFWRHQFRVVERGPATDKITCIGGEGHPIAEDCGCYPGWNKTLKAARASNPTSEQRDLIKAAKYTSNGDPRGLGSGRDKAWDKERVDRELGRTVVG